MSKMVHVVGARPNFMKVAPIHRSIQNRGKLKQRLIHTGQHYDTNMSDVFFADLGLPQPDLHLGIGSGSHAEQTARVMIELEKTLNLRIVDPMGYLPFLALLSQARLVLTDSGGIQEESSALGVPCLTLRENTERPITIELGAGRGESGADPLGSDRDSRRQR